MDERQYAAWREIVGMSEPERQAWAEVDRVVKEAGARAGGGSPSLEDIGAIATAVFAAHDRRKGST